MTKVKTTYNRRTFLKTTALAGGGMLLSFSWLAACAPSKQQVAQLPKNWFNLNGYLKIAENGQVTIQSPNPEIGQNVKTSMPMIVAEELDVDWKQVIVEQAPLNTDIFSRQIAGGSQSIRQSWKALRTAGATARQMLREAAAANWKVPVTEITTDKGILFHKNSGKSATYGEMAAAAAAIPVPKEVTLKDVKDFKIIGTSRKNVDGQKIVTGKPLFGIDYQREGMLIAMIVHPPAFGLTLKSIDDSEARKMPGIREVFSINTYPATMTRGAFDVDAFPEMAVIVGNSTWEVMQAKKALKVSWEHIKPYSYEMDGWRGKTTVNVPDGLESSETHTAKMAEMAAQTGKVLRKDGDPETAFKNAATIIERHYTAPFLAHNTMEPMNFFAHVTDEKAELVGPIQTPEFMEKSVAARLGLPLEKVDIQMTRMGGGFGRRLYGHFLVEAAVISQKIKAPVKLIYTREDDMTDGVYRPAYHVTYRAALDANKQLLAIHVRGGGVPDSPVHANRFPAGAIDNYLAEEWSVATNISTGAFRAPGSNFIASAEQSFLDEVAEAMGKDPIDMRLEMLQRAQSRPVGEKNDYDAVRYAGVLKLVKEKAAWGSAKPGVHRGVSAYFCHNSYVANVLELHLKDGKPVVDKAYCAIDCGIVVNPDAAANMAEGSVVDAIGHALYSKLTLKDGVPEQTNFHEYRMIRHHEAPKNIEVHFVKSDVDPTGLGEPIYPPVFAALANALYKATGKRFYNQPFFPEY